MIPLTEEHSKVFLSQAKLGMPIIQGALCDAKDQVCSFKARPVLAGSYVAIEVSHTLLNAPKEKLWKSVTVCMLEPNEDMFSSAFRIACLHKAEEIYDKKQAERATGFPTPRVKSPKPVL